MGLRDFGSCGRSPFRAGGGQSLRAKEGGPRRKWHRFSRRVDDLGPEPVKSRMRRYVTAWGFGALAVEPTGTRGCERFRPEPGPRPKRFRSPLPVGSAGLPMVLPRSRGRPAPKVPGPPQVLRGGRGPTAASRRPVLPHL